MRFFFPYNEILPKKRAHDLYLISLCHALASLGHDVTLLIGKGSEEKEVLFAHYGISSLENFRICCLPIVRKNNLFNLSWNRIFFSAVQKTIQKEKPDWVVLSVYKQGIYHLKRKVPGVKYLFDLHQLQGYPPPIEEAKKEAQMLQNADQILVTTEPLRTLLLDDPYKIKTPIHVLPLATEKKALSHPSTAPFTIAYVGQLYKGQGVPFLIRAMAETKECHLRIIGGSEQEIKECEQLAESLGISKRIDFLGFQPPSSVEEKLENVDAFVAPFDGIGRMKYVAHTKLIEYAAWQRPIIAPRFPIVSDHFPKGDGWCAFEEGKVSSLATAIEKAKTCMTLPKRPMNWQEKATALTEILSLS